MWNPDDVLSTGLARFIGLRTLREDAFYTAPIRFDPAAPRDPMEENSTETLQRLEQRCLIDAYHKGSLLEDSLAFLPERNAHLQRFERVCTHGDQGALEMEKTGRRYEHNWFAGDFLMAPRVHWERLGGFLELPFTEGIDGAAVCALHASSLRQVVVGWPSTACFVCHQHHDREPAREAAINASELCKLAAEGYALDAACTPRSERLVTGGSPATLEFRKWPAEWAQGLLVPCLPPKITL